jgi:GxxExxY protein
MASPVPTAADRQDSTAETAEKRGGRRGDENRLGELVLGCALTVHKALGPGLLESAYEVCLAHELDKAGLRYKRQIVLPVFYDDQQIDAGYRLDLLVEDLVVIEIKAVETISEIHQAQLLSYLKLGGYRLGYLLNFNVTRLKDGICRLVYGL